MSDVLFIKLDDYSKVNHTDVLIKDVATVYSNNKSIEASCSLFSTLYENLTGLSSNNHTTLELGYSIGIPLGILIFYNHFGKRRITTDPTPIEIEMRLYENDINTTLIENITRKGENVDVDN